MLLQATVPPNLLAGLPGDPFTQKLFCNLWLGLLYDLVESCIVIFPGNHHTDGDYLAAVSGWPAKYQKRAQELITKLRQRRRLIPSQISYIPAATCVEASCQPFVGVSTVNAENFHLAPEKCAGCVNVVALAPRSIEALEYFISEFSRRRRDKLALVLGDGQWRSTDFEREVLKPLFTSAKHVKIYDRWIGRSAFNRWRGTVRFNDNYKRTLEWVAQAFQSVGGAARGGVFELYCGIEGHCVSPPQRVRLRAEMQNFQAAVQAATGVAIQVVLKEESRTSTCPHGRFLITDQAAVLIDRGFDLLWDDTRMHAAGLNPATDPRPVRDVAVVLCSDCNAVDSQTRLLPAL
jgi:hypothetical protein